MQQNIDLRKNGNRSTWIGLTRIMLGVVLLWKGLLFTQDASVLEAAIQQTGIGEHDGFLHVVAAMVSILTLVSGIFIMVGLFTRLLSYIQIVVISLGLAFIYTTGIHRNNFEVISTIIIVSLLVFITNKGSGPISFDRAIEGITSEQTDLKTNLKIE